MLRIVFMGTPEFAVPSLQALAREHEVVAVYTRPDAASGRGSRLRPGAVKAAALDLDLTLEQPRTLRDPQVQAHLASYKPDLCVVAAYGLILPPEVLAIPQLGCINVHGSLLPRWRGAAPVQRAILAGDIHTGVSIMQMEEGLDTGPFCEIEVVSVEDKSAPELTNELARIGAAALLRAVERIEARTCEWTEQDPDTVTYAEKLTKAEVALSPDLTADEALRRIRASGAQAPARAIVGDRGVTVTRASLGQEAVEPGRVALTAKSAALGLRDGSLVIERIKPDGKREMSAEEWACGTRLADGARWGDD